MAKKLQLSFLSSLRKILKSLFTHYLSEKSISLFNNLAKSECKKRFIHRCFMYKFDTFERTSRKNEYKPDKLSKISSAAHNDK